MSNKENITEISQMNNAKVKAISSGSKTIGMIQVVEFILGENVFAVDLFDTREVITSIEVTPIPNSPIFVKGIIDLRGTITTIIDLKLMMHINSNNIGKTQSRIIVLDKTVSEKSVGILVDDVYSVSTYANEEIDRTDQANNVENKKYILGIIRKLQNEKNKEKLVIWLNIKYLIDQVENSL